MLPVSCTILRDPGAPCTSGAVRVHHPAMDRPRNGRAPDLSTAPAPTGPQRSLPLLLERYADGDGVHAGPWPGRSSASG